MKPSQGVAVEPNGNEPLNRPTSPDCNVLEPAHATSRFVYATGARPLAGYTIKRGVGQGGFGEIYYAVSDAGKEVALKLIRRNLEVELRGIRQCLNLKHGNLLNLFDIRQDDQGDTWVVMEYVPGEQLEQLLAAKPNGFSPSEALVWIHGIGAGVAYLHDHGIVHRDLKPGNIFLDEGIVKIGDYGLSKYISCSRRSGHTESIGTVHYMAPEIAGGHYGKEIDVYAMGVILFELLTGRVPFEGESIGEVLMKHLTAKPDVSALAEPYRSVVARALEKDPTLRYRSAAEMLAALPSSSPLLPGVGPGVRGNAGDSPLPLGEGLGVRGTANKSSIARWKEKLSAASDEPILRAVGRAGGNLGRGVRKVGEGVDRALNRTNLNTPTKIILLLVGAYVAIQVAPILVAVVAFLAVFSIPLLILYGIYRLVRSFFVGTGASSDREPTTPAKPPGAPSAAAVQTAPSIRRRRREKPIVAMVVKPPRERLTDLIGSLLVSALVCTVMCVVATLVYAYDNIPLRPERAVWLLLVSMAGTWAILVPSKLWEGTQEEASFRRFVMMVAGLLTGGVGCITAGLLMVDLPSSSTFSYFPNLFHFQRDTGFYAADGRPLMMAYVGCFGTLFLLLRWWFLANPLRSTRLSLWSLAVCVVLASAVADAWQFPQPWLPMVAGTMAVALQLSSPWISPDKRVRKEVA